VPWLEIACTGVTALRLHPWRSVATVACVVAALGPYLTGLGIAGGLARQAAQSLEEGADLYVTGTQFGRTVPLPLEAAEKIAALPGVVKAVPRIVGKLTLGDERHPALVVGMPPREMPSLDFIEGELFRDEQTNELVIGSQLASDLKLHVGSLLPPFYRNRQGEKVSKVVGIFRADAPVWQANLIFTSFHTAARLFDQPALATDVLVYCRAGAAEELSSAIRRRLHWDLADGSRLDVQVAGRDGVRALWTVAAAHRDGVFHLHWMLAVSIGILAVLVTSGFGGTERRYEVGVLKAIGWRTDEILLRNLIEGLLLTAAGASLAVLVTWCWLAALNGWAIAALFVPGLGWRPRVDVPFSLAPLPVVLGTLLSWLVVTSGSLYTTWRTAMTAPAGVMRSVA
jgi:ABC-type lipoprotein release transport system permease subunit